MEQEISSQTSVSTQSILQRIRPGMVLTLVLFWTILSGTINWQHLLTGLLASLFITFFWGDYLLDEREGLPLTMRRISLIFIYVKDLIIEIIKANIEVVKIVLDPKLPISPCFVRYKISLNKTLSQVILANSITLTPGTLSTFLQGDEIIVHALTRDGAETIVDWRMHEELQKMEEAGE